MNMVEMQKLKYYDIINVKSVLKLKIIKYANREIECHRAILEQNTRNSFIPDLIWIERPFTIKLSHGNWTTTSAA